MKAKYYYRVFLLFCLYLFCGCGGQTAPGTIPAIPPDSTADEPSASTPGNYYPLAAGNYWIYEGDGNEYASFTRKVEYASGDLTQLSDNNGGTVVTTVLSRDDNGITRIYFEPESYSPGNLLETGFSSNDNTLLLKYPLEPGTAWASGDCQKLVETNGIEIRTPAGVFDDCVKIKLTWPQSDGYEYYKAGIGMIKQEFLIEGGTISSTLKEYHIAE